MKGFERCIIFHLSLIPQKKLGCNHLLLRRAAVSCLRQLSQREAWEVCDHALNLGQGGEEQDQGNINVYIFHIYIDVKRHQS